MSPIDRARKAAARAALGLPDMNEAQSNAEADRIIAAYEASLAADGLVIVPRVASEGMCVTAYRVWHKEAGYTAHDFHKVWSAMIAASEGK